MAASRTGVTPTDALGNVATLAAIDPVAFNDVAKLQDSWFVDGSAAHMMTALRERPAGVLVNSALANGLKLKTGDTAKVLFGRGTDQQTRKTVKVLGLFTQFPGAPAGTDRIASLAYYQQVTHLMNADFYLASTTDGGRPGLTRAVHALSSLRTFDRNLNVQTSAGTLDKDQSSLTALNVRGLLQLNSFFTFLMAATATAMFVFGLSNLAHGWSPASSTQRRGWAGSRRRWSAPKPNLGLDVCDPNRASSVRRGRADGFSEPWLKSCGARVAKVEGETVSGLG